MHCHIDEMEGNNKYFILQQRSIWDIVALFYMHFIQCFPQLHARIFDKIDECGVQHNATQKLSIITEHACTHSIFTHC